MAWHVTLAWLVAASFFVAAGERDSLPFEAPSGIEQGERQYKAVLAKIPEYGPCWSDAVSRLERGCDELTEELQGRLALAFTSCFLEKMGQAPIRCPESQPLSRCPVLAQFLEKPLATSYTQFFTHTQVICAFLRSRKWQAEAARTITELGVSSVRATAELRRAAETQKQLQRRQEQMFAHTEHLRRELASAHSTLREHREMLDTSLHRLSYVQAFFVEQFATLHSLGYYGLAVVLSFLMTTSKRTAGSRPWLLLLFFFNLLIERMIVKLASDDAVDRAAPLASDSPLGSYIGLSRRIVCLVALCVYLYQLYSFQDLLAVNNQLLQDLHAEMRTLHTYQSLFGRSQRREPNLAETNAGSSEESSSSESEESDAGMWSLDDMFDGDSQDDYSDDDDDNDDDSNDDDDDDNDDDDDDESRSNFGDNAFRETDTKSGAGLSTKKDSDAQPNEASSAAQSGWGGLSMLGALVSPSTQVVPSSPMSPSAVSAVTGSRYNLRPRRSLNSSSDPLSPSHLQSPSRRRDLALPRQTLGQAAILSSDED